MGWDWGAKFTPGALCPSGNTDIWSHLGHRVLISLTKETQRAVGTSTENRIPLAQPGTFFCVYFTVYTESPSSTPPPWAELRSEVYSARLGAGHNKGSIEQPQHSAAGYDFISSFVDYK